MTENNPKPLPLLTQDDIRRFWSKVDKSDGQGTHGKCWTWRAANVKGYGVFKVKGRMLKAHRVAFFLTTGVDPVNKVMRHKCDNPPCVNPACLLPGTSADNTADRVARNRSATGDRNGSRQHPERLTKGDDHWTRKNRERAADHLRNAPRACGERQHSAKLTSSQVTEIRQQFANGTSVYRLAANYGVSWMSVNKIIKRITWKHI